MYLELIYVVVIVQEPIQLILFVYISFYFFIGSNVLIGDFAAILASFVMALYITYSKDVIREDKCPLSFTLAMLGSYIVCFSFAFAYITGNKINIFSAEGPNGLLSFQHDK